MRFWRRFADVSGKIVLAVDKSSIRLPKTDCKCQESTTKCHVLLFYFSVLCFILSPLIEAPHKNKNNWHLLSKFLFPKPERNFKMKCTWKTMHNFILLRFFFIYLFFFCRANWLKWIFLALVKIQVDYKLTNYAHKFLDIFIAIKVAFFVLLFPLLFLLLLVRFSFQKLNCFEWPIYCLRFLSFCMQHLKFFK